MAEETKPAQAAPPSSRLKWAGLVVLALLVVGGIVFWVTRGHESTDDAQIEGRITPIASRVGGAIVELNVEENQYVEAGFVIAKIDERDYVVAVERARAELADAEANALAAGRGVPIAEVSTASDVRTASGGVAEAEAGVIVADRQVEAARAELVAAEARLRERQATATKAARDVERFAPLVKKEEIAQQQYDAAVATADAARAAVDAAQSEVAAARTSVAVAEQRAVQARATAAQAHAALETAQTAPDQLKVSKARAESAEARVKQARANLARAELDLERTTIKAPSAGVIGRKAIELGQIVAAGQPLMSIVSLADVWVVANYKETQLADVRPGQRVTVEVDGLDGREFRAHVASIAGATGAKFSLLPPENATGNYVKVVQRVPVRIEFEPDQDPEHLLRPGMSVIPTIYTR